MSKIINVSNNKGGVLKTTTALSVASILAKKYQKNVLIIDTDLQSNISTAFEIKTDSLSVTFYDLLSKEYSSWKMEEKLELLVKSIINDVYLGYEDQIDQKRKEQSLIKNKINFLKRNKNINKVQRKIELYEQQIEIIDKEIKILEIENNSGSISILPSNNSIAFKNLEFENNKEDILKEVKKFILYLKNTNYYDYIIIDSAPNLNIIQESVLDSIDSLIIPLEMEYYSIKGLTKMLNLIEMHKKTNPNLKVEAILPTKINTRSKLHKDVYKILVSSLEKRNEYLNSLVEFKYGIPISIQDASSIGYNGKPLFLTRDFNKVKQNEKLWLSYLHLTEMIL